MARTYTADPEGAGMRRVYIALPYTGVEEWSERTSTAICKHLLEVASGQILPLAPCLYFPRFLPNDDRTLIMKYCKALLCTCDAIWLYGPTISPGMRQEIEWVAAHSLAIEFKPLPSE